MQSGTYEAKCGSYVALLEVLTPFKIISTAFIIKNPFQKVVIGFCAITGSREIIYDVTSHRTTSSL